MNRRTFRLDLAVQLVAVIAAEEHVRSVTPRGLLVRWGRGHVPKRRLKQIRESFAALDGAPIRPVPLAREQGPICQLESTK